MSQFKKITTKNTPSYPKTTKKRKISDTLNDTYVNVSDSSSHTININTNDVWAQYRFTVLEREELMAKVRQYTIINTDEAVPEGQPHKKQRTDSSSKNVLSKNSRVDTGVNRTVRRSSRLASKTNTESTVNNKKRKTIDNNTNSDVSSTGRTPISSKNLCWISATKTKNYLLDDQCVDWLTLYYSTYGLTDTEMTDFDRKIAESYLKDASHIDLLLDGGNTFESKVYDELKEIFKDDFVIVFDESDMQVYRATKDIEGMIRGGNEKVRQLMLNGTPIIAQAPLINDNNMTFGVADILIRSDYLEKLFNMFTPDDEINVSAPYLNPDKSTGKGYHYRVIDCKWTTMVLCVDGLTIRNEGFFPAYKGQLAVYTACLESLQGYVPKIAYIMPKAWRIDKANIPNEHAHLYRGYSAFDRPGVINYAERDSDYLSKTKDAIKWMQRVVTDGREWRYSDDAPSVPELYPNMNKSNPAFDGVKNIIANKYKDPTMVWYVGPEHRRNAHRQGVYSLDDKRCNTDVLGITTSRAKTINAIIDINRPTQTDDLVRPLCIKNNMGDWQNDQYLDYYIDFETINYNLYVEPRDMDIENSYVDSDVTFMIGIGFEHNPSINTNELLESLGVDKSKYDYLFRHDSTTGWEFVCLFLTEFSVFNELEIFRLFFDFINARSELHRLTYNLKNAEISRLFHWTGAEIRFINRAIDRIKSGKYVSVHRGNTALNLQDKMLSDASVHDYLNNLIDTFEQRTLWVDMYKVFETEPIVVKGSYRFKLKHIGNAFYSNGLIDTHWDNGRMSDGFRAMFEAIKLYRQSKASPNDQSKTISRTNQLYREIIDYNEVDCRVIWEIVNYLRDNHCVQVIV